MKRLFTTLAVVIMAVTIYAQSAREEIKANKYLSGSQYLDYNRRLPDKPLTPTPKGYEPFYMSHYGRHGSRWLISDNSYIGPRNTLRDAKDQGKLTPLGEETLRKIEAFEPTSVNRLGDLSTVGERQHHGIGKRLAENFPEIFKAKNVPIDARSTTVNRCILSMIAECEELAQANPSARIHNEANEANMSYMNAPKDGLSRANEGKARPIQNEWSAKMRDPRRLMKVLFTDQDWVYMNVMPTSLMGSIYDIAVNQQIDDSNTELLDLFTVEELYRLWNGNNLYWYLNYANAPQTGNAMHWQQANLLRNIIETADTVTQTQATLRFGHDTVVLPIIALLELGGFNCSIDNLEELDTYFRSYQAVPYACNVQLVFYRPKKGKAGDILVKALFNENEVTMPVETNMYPYYKWADVKAYYEAKLKKQPKSPFPATQTQERQVPEFLRQMMNQNQ